MRIALIAALDRHGAIGRAGQLPWHLPDDLKHFKALTLGKPVLMGRRTFGSIGRPLPGRRNLVLSRAAGFRPAGVEVYTALDDALAAAREGGAEELMVIGGGELYAQLLPSADVLHLTEVDTTVADADAWFPRFERRDWQEVRRQSHAANARHALPFDIVELTRSMRGMSHPPD